MRLDAINFAKFSVNSEFQIRSMKIKITFMDTERKGTLIMRRRYWRNIGLEREFEEEERPLETVGSILILLQNPRSVWRCFYTYLSISEPDLAPRVKTTTTTSTTNYKSGEVSWGELSMLGLGFNLLGWADDLGSVNSF